MPPNMRHSNSPLYSGDILHRRHLLSSSALSAGMPCSSFTRKISALPKSQPSSTEKGPPTSAPRAAGIGGQREALAGKPHKASSRGNWPSSSTRTCLTAGARTACSRAPSKLPARSSESASPVASSQTSKTSIATPPVVSNQPRRIRTRWARKVLESTGKSSGWLGTWLSNTTVMDPRVLLTTTPPLCSARRLRYSVGSAKPRLAPGAARPGSRIAAVSAINISSAVEGLSGGPRSKLLSSSRTVRALSFSRLAASSSAILAELASMPSDPLLDKDEVPLEAWFESKDAPVVSRSSWI
mmetsp:Transcript_58935/g.175350  ORF Transcript_58935/g.175350 Transcript_58935/m.175350 type:complete len:298 (-) Transcript_58935:228-1121(-)